MASSILSEDKSVSFASFARAISMELIMDPVITEKVVAMEKVLTTERAIMEEELTTGRVATMTSAIPGHLEHWECVAVFFSFWMTSVL